MSASYHESATLVDVLTAQSVHEAIYHGFDRHTPDPNDFATYRRITGRWPPENAPHHQAIVDSWSKPKRFTPAMRRAWIGWRKKFMADLNYRYHHSYQAKETVDLGDGCSMVITDASLALADEIRCRNLGPGLQELFDSYGALDQ